jgi:hypothetical protein
MVDGKAVRGALDALVLGQCSIGYRNPGDV